MAIYHQVSHPVNDGEREVLRLLRLELDDAWHVVGNFSIQQGTRTPYECDALAVSPSGWAYLIEVKAWTGQIVGNDSQWQLPALGSDGFSYRPNPVTLTELKARVLNSVLREHDPPLKAVFIQPLVVLVSNDTPLLTGLCAGLTVVVSELLDRVRSDPREYSRKTPADVASRVAEVLVANSRPIAPETVLGSWELVEQVDGGPNWDIWSARNRLAGSQTQMRRLKRYRLDSLLTGLERSAQRVRARHDLEALERLAGVDGAVPLVGTVEEFEDSLVVVTDWPNGRTLASMLETGIEDQDEAEELAEGFLAALASIHRQNVIHRNLSPRCIHFLRSHRVVITDFDYARVPSVEGITRFIEDELAEPFTPPEVQADPAAATSRSDVWTAARICAQIFGAVVEDGSVALEPVPGEWREVLARALDPDPVARPDDADLLLAELRRGSSSRTLFDGFEPNDELESRWVVKSEPVGEGGLARVYRVWDTSVGTDFAAKFVRPEYAGQIDPADEYKLLLDVPPHPSLVRPEFTVNMSKFRRKTRQHEYRTTFLLTRWIEGTRLDRLIREKLPPARCCEIALALAEGIGHLHRYDLIHRDLKPANVIVDSRGCPRIVDFNVSKTQETADRTQTGTPRYRPPDLAETGWTPAADVYSLGAIFCELLAGHTLEPGDTVWTDDPTLPEGLKLVALRSVSADRDVRYASAGDFAQALRDASDELILAEGIPDDPEQVFPAATPEELSRSNWNPYQARIASLFSQSSVSNAGTRGLNDFARWAYVPTLIDETLYSDLLDGRYRLLLITGNAGDGKTAFIQMMESRLESSGWSVLRRDDGNGASLSRGTDRLVTNWDGSQDEGEADNDDVLLDFFGPFRGDEPQPPEEECRVIAINEGRLLDFLSQNREAFPWLSKRLLSYFEEEQGEDAPWLGIVNLNLRALTIGSEGRTSLVAKLLEKFTDQRLWQPCQTCAAATHCYARANAAALRDPVLGPRASERIRLTLDLARLRRQLHITMRDLRSALAWTVVGNRTCDEIVRLVEDSDRERLLSGHLYNALFAASDKLQPPVHAPEAAADRLLRIVGTLDVAQTAGPEDDARIWSEGVEALLPEPSGLDRSDRELLSELRERLPLSARELSDRRARADLRLLHSSLRRKLFLEREEPKWIGMLPYDRLEEFMRLLTDCSDSDRDDLTRAISQSEGLFSEEFRDVLAVRLASESSGAERSFATHPAPDFELFPLDRTDRARYVEYAPDTLRLQHKTQPSLALDIDLDLFETLVRVLDGFTPSREELRGTWLNLRVFKEQVASLRSDELLLSLDDRTFHHVRRSQDARQIEVVSYS